MIDSPSPAVAPLASAASRFRWWIVVLLFFSTTINYVDRALFSNLVPYFEADLKLGPMDLATINVAFLLTYGLGMTFVGLFVDRVGVRIGLALTFVLWNVASMGHALVGSVGSFVLMRILLGVGEAGNFPSAIRTVAEWFPKKERALATGWFNCGSNVGAIATPLLAPLIADRFGWRACFAIVGGLGLIWVFFWLRMYRKPEEHPSVSPGELAWIRSDAPEAETGTVHALELLGRRQVYGYAFAKFFSEAPWWFYLFWMPKFLADTAGLGSTGRAWAIAFIYVVADVGSVAGGWVSSALVRRGHSLNAARKFALLISAVAVLPVVGLAFVHGPTTGGISSLWLVLPAIAIAAAAHQAWSANLYTVVSDTLPKRAVATTVGIGTAFGSVGSSAFQVAVAFWLIKAQNYALPFVLAGTLYLFGLLSLHLLMPRLQPAVFDGSDRRRVKWWQVALVSVAVVASLAAFQVYLNTPPYRTFDDYLAKRAQTLGATATEGPTVKVGWQDARWTRWTTAAGVSRWELVRLDRNGRPLVEEKGPAAKGYVGPTIAELEAGEPRR